MLKKNVPISTFFKKPASVMISHVISVSIADNESHCGCARAAIVALYAIPLADQSVDRGPDIGCAEKIQTAGRSSLATPSCLLRHSKYRFCCITEFSDL
jgi:hypothetical protein